MKRYFKYLLLVVLLFQVNLVKAEPANEAFDDDIFYKCVVDAYNKEHSSNTKQYTDSLSDVELESIFKLSCYGGFNDKSIVSTKGLEKLTQLKSLDLFNNKISEIDVSMLTKLTDLNLGNNNLSAIDVRKNTELTELDLGSNNISAIDVSMLTQLTELGLDSNNLSEIDVRKNTELTRLTLSNNNLSAIDLSKNTQLTYLGLGSNNLSAIDLSKNTQLKYLNLGNNKISEIDVHALTKLTHLDLQWNNLSKIDLSKNTQLTSLTLLSNKISEIDVSMLTKLLYLSLGSTGLSKIDLSKNTQLTELGLGSNNISAIDVHMLTKLQRLDLEWNNLSEIDLSKNTQLTSLNLWHNNLSVIDVSKNTQLKYLNLAGNKLLSLNVDELNNLTFIKNSIQYTEFSKQSRIITPKVQNNKYIINLKEYDSKLDPSKVKLEQEGIEYDNNSGIITFLKKPKTINYTYITSKEKDMNVTITIQNDPPVISTFYIGGKNNPTEIDSNKTQLYLSWLDDDVVSYCISETNDIRKCKWENTKSKEITLDWELSGEEGEKVLYAFIKDDGNLVSDVAIDKVNVKYPVIQESPKEEVKPNTSENKPQDSSKEEVPEDADKPLDKSPQTGGYLVGSLVLIGLVIGLYYKYYLVRKNKINKI